MSEDDDAERNAPGRSEYTDADALKEGEQSGKTVWRKNVEQALTKLAAEMAALREQIHTGREFKGKRSRSLSRWVAWFIWLAIRHILVDALLLGVVLLWFRRKKDRRVEDLVREALKVAREYVRRILPAR